MFERHKTEFNYIKNAADMAPVINYFLANTGTLVKTSAKSNNLVGITKGNGNFKNTRGVIATNYDASTGETFATLVTLGPAKDRNIRKLEKIKKALSFPVQAGEQARLLATADFITPADNEASVSGDSRPRKDSAYGTVNITEADTLVKKFSYNADNSPKYPELHNEGDSHGYDFSALFQSTPRTRGGNPGIHRSCY